MWKAGLQYTQAGYTTNVDPALVPVKVLAGGAKMPAIGLGTFGSDHVTSAQIASAVQHAARIGYRHFDCAAVYDNEPAVGEALQHVWRESFQREAFWITSKLWNDKHAARDVGVACRQSLHDLKLDYLDLYLVHWPFRNFHPPGCEVTSRSADSHRYIHDEFMETWGEMERLVEQGLIRHIGTSNVTQPKLELILRDAHIAPACNEMELHPHFQQSIFLQYLQDRRIQPIGFCPLGSPGRPERDRTEEDTSPMEDTTIVALARERGVHPAEVCLKWAVQRGEVAIPFSINPRNYLANLRAVTHDPLSDEEMSRIDKTDRNNRLIKGQVFLWKADQDWRDLWDETGQITV